MRGKKISPTHLRTFSVQRSEGEKKKNQTNNKLKIAMKTTSVLVARLFFFGKKSFQKKFQVVLCNVMSSASEIPVMTSAVAVLD